ncbi:MAG: Gfo/Idh/MocA family protein [Anaerolineaceae bacterium]
MAIRIAVIGAGYIGEIHAKAVKNLAGAELVAVVDQNEEKARDFAAKHSIPHTYYSLDELIKSHTSDAIIIGTPNFLHAQQAISAMKAGIHVMVEKPMALNVDEAKLMVQASNETACTLMVGHCWRYDSEVNWLRDQVNLNRLGNIVRTKGYGIHENWGPSGWFVEKKLSGGGALVDMGIHAIDTARYLLGDPEPESVYAQLGTFYGSYDVDDTGLIIINWKGGAVSYIESGWWQPFSDGPEAATQLFGLKGYGSIFPTCLRIPNLANESVEVIENGYQHPREEHCEQIMYDQQMSHFVTCINEKSTPNSSALKGLTNMKILAAAYKSNETKELVKIEET